jgi:hypothetical protein
MVKFLYFGPASFHFGCKKKNFSAQAFSSKGKMLLGYFYPKTTCMGFINPRVFESLTDKRGSIDPQQATSGFINPEEQLEQICFTKQVQGLLLPKNQKKTLFCGRIGRKADKLLPF